MTTGAAPSTAPATGAEPRGSWIAGLIETGEVRRVEGSLKTALTAYAVLVGLGLLYANVVAYVHPWTLAAAFMGTVSAMVFLLVKPSPRSHPTRPSPLDWALAALSLAIGIYFVAGSGRYVERIPIMDPLGPVEKAVGVLFVALAIEATRRTTGVGLTAVALVFLAYNVFGQYLPGVIGHGGIDLETFLDNMVYSTYGINGVVAGVAATYAFLFVLFGEFLNKTGGGEFFFRVAAALTGRSVGGPAKIAVVSSSLYGTISGNAVADVVTTGSVNIPVMKRLGYPPALAAAVEVTASSGGSLTPPVMGAAAFVMAEFTGIPYGEIALAAIGPSLLYYLAVFGQVHYYSKRRRFAGLEAGAVPPLLRTLREGSAFLVPLAVLCAALALGYTPTYAAVLATVAVVAVAALRKSTRIGPRGVLDALAAAVFRLVVITGTCAAAGLVIAGMTMTGLAPKISFLVNLLTGGALFPALLIAAVVTIVLGLGLPTVSSYVLAAVLMGPLMENLGVPKLAAHMFLLYYAVLSVLTPPVAVAATAAASIAEANPNTVGFLAMRLAIVAFLVPFGFVYGPEILGIGTPVEVAVALGSAAAGAWLLCAVMEGYLHRGLGRVERAVLGAAALALMVPLGLATSLVGMAVVGSGLWLWLRLDGRRRRAAADGPVAVPAPAAPLPSLEP